jgi:hypothetical protein
MSYSSTLEVPGTKTGHAHNYSGEKTVMTFVNHFIFTHADHEREVFRAGTYEVPVEVAGHWYAIAHTDTPQDLAPAPGTPAYAERLRKDGLAANAKLREQQNLDMALAAQVNRKAIEETTRLEVTDKIKAELKVQFDAQLTDAVKAAVAQALAAQAATPAAPPPGPPDAPAAAEDAPKGKGK